MGRSQKERGRDGRSRTASSSASELVATVTGLNHQAVAAAGRNELDDATRLLRRALELAPSASMTHQNLGAVAFLQNRVPEAASHFETATRLDPASAKAHFNLANAYRSLGRAAAAIPHLQRVLQLDPTHHSAGHILAVCTQMSPEAPSPAFVEALFDQFASTFDETIVNELAYTAPAKLRALLEEALEASSVPLRFDHAVDLGCGTGLSGRAFADVCGAITGVDLSAKMLERADGTGLYARLVRTELREFLVSTEERFELFVAVDTLNYLGNLEPVMNGVAKCARGEAHFVFSTEAGEAGEARDDGDRSGFALSGTGRYTHSRAYVERLAERSGMRLVLCRQDHLRNELNGPVEGDLFVYAIDANRSAATTA